MLCNKCGGAIDEKTKKCPFCGTSSALENVQLSQQLQSTSKNKKTFFKTGYIFVIIGIVSILISFIVMDNSKEPTNDRAEALLNIEKNNYTKFSFNDKEFYLGDKVSKYKENKISFEDQYLTEESYVESDSIAIYNFYNQEEETQFLGAFYCAEKEKCKYDDSLLIKINFYENTNVIIDDFIKYGIKYDEVVEKYGKEDGSFYQDEDLLVWSFGEKGKIGNPYYVLRFNYSKKISEIRMGIWWYEGEYTHTVKAINKEGE